MIVLITTIHYLALGLLTIYAVHRLYLTYLFRKFRNPNLRISLDQENLPRVTVQLPIFNERFVVKRLLRAVGNMEYPCERFEVQVLDDSTDDTSDVLANEIEELRKKGIRVRHMRRNNRIGFKAGALEAGLRIAEGEFIAVFDADFIPPPHFLLEGLSYFRSPKIGLVQACWGHVNENHSILTCIEAMMIDGHFTVEHMARSKANLFFNFNGTAGIWRKEAIESSGGWQHDTLTEDLDLSYRAQMKGWQFAFADSLVVPAELPQEMGALRSQQHRWAKGSAQTARKVLGKILRSDFPMQVKLETFFHLTANSVYVYIAILSITAPYIVQFPLEFSFAGIGVFHLGLIHLSLISMSIFFLVAERDKGRSIAGTICRLPFLICVGVGLALNNTMALLEGLLGLDSPFVRTPKTGDWVSQTTGKKYRSRFFKLSYLEWILSAYLIVHIVILATERIFSPIPVLILFTSGYLYTAVLTTVEQFTWMENRRIGVFLQLKRRFISFLTSTAIRETKTT